MCHWLSWPLIWTQLTHCWTISLITYVLYFMYFELNVNGPYFVILVISALIHMIKRHLTAVLPTLGIHRSAGWCCWVRREREREPSWQLTVGLKSLGAVTPGRSATIAHLSNHTHTHTRANHSAPPAAHQPHPYSDRNKKEHHNTEHANTVFQIQPVVITMSDLMRSKCFGNVFGKNCK